jgi:PDDEXK-like domain of unknown function (DUF3799)
VSVATTSAKLVTETNESYHANPAIGRSMLWDYRNRKRMYQRKYILKAIAKIEPSNQMRLGTLVHALMLEPGTFDELFVRAPDEFVTDSGALSKSKKAAEWTATISKLGRTPYTGEEYDKAERMVTAMQSVVAPWLKFPRENEKSIYWTDEISGLPCKCRPDWLMIAGDVAIVPDVKTTQSITPRNFRTSMEDYGYHLQQSHYTAGIMAAYGVSAVDFMFLTVESNEPFQSTIYRMPEEAVEKAAMQRTRLLCELRESIEKSAWKNDYEVGINELAPRDFAFE